jgi:hypothetical protein
MILSKENFINRYMNKKLKSNKLPYGLIYLNWIAEYEILAEKRYKEYLKKKNNK